MSCFPWPEPKGVYDDDGPPVAQRVTFAIDGVVLTVERTTLRAFNSNRTRWKVICESCHHTLHEGTTSASSIARGHLAHRHGIKRAIAWEVDDAGD